MTSEYVELQEGQYLAAGSRVSLASLVACWKEGLSAESIRDEFPTLRLEQVYGAITYYLRNQTEVDSHLASLATDFQSRAEEQASLYPEITMKLRTAMQAAKR